MYPRFQEFADKLHPSFENLVSMSPVDALLLPKVPGIYLFSEGDNHLYVGRTRNLFQRYGKHAKRSSSSNQASFAFLLTREATGHTLAGYHRGGLSREALMLDPELAKAFTEAKERVRRMDCRYVEEGDPTCQALLEIYCAVALETPYNSFVTH
jgi:predicted GIY-YIG superfamily endonuclease